MRGLAFRRFQERKKKRWVSKHFANYWMNGLDSVKIGLRAHTPAICSCPACGNPRKHWKQQTIQELRFLETKINEGYNE